MSDTTNKLKKGFKILDTFIKTVDKVVDWFKNLKRWTETIESGLKHTKGFKEDVVRIWNKEKDSSFTDDVELNLNDNKDD